jgi:hypothetical protein
MEPTKCQTEPNVGETSSLPSPEEFFREYVNPSRPLVLRGGASGWSALHWSAAHLQQWDEEVVNVAPLQVHGPHAFFDKWLERPQTWGHMEAQPTVVHDEALLVVAAARARMSLHRFLELIQPKQSGVAATFYADGAGNLGHSFPFLRDDFEAPPFAALLDLKRADLWIGGKTISR